MGTNICGDEEDYIDMELTSSPSTKSRDFEFFTFDERETSPSPADELFYKGKLLPLHLPPRRQMVEHLLRTNAAAAFVNFSTAPCTTANTPSDSCNISPSESCRASCDLNPSDSFFEWPNELSNFIANHHHHEPRNSINSWSKKLIKRSVLAQKLKSSRNYLRSLFTRSICSDESPSKADANRYQKMGKKIADIIKSIDGNGGDEIGNRRSFSGAIKRHSPTKCLSSSSSSSSSCSSFNSSGVRVNFLRRSSSSNEIEGSIDAAIAHCKKSMQNDSKIAEIGIA